METGKKYWRWGWWAIFGLVAILILIGLIIAGIASRGGNTADETGSVVETSVETDTEDSKDTVKEEVKDDSDTEEKKTDTSNSDSKKEAKSGTTSEKKKEEPAVVTRCKSKAYMEKTLRGSTDLDCNSAEGIARFKASENAGGVSTPNSSAGPEVSDNGGSLPKSGPEDVLPIFIILAAFGFLVTPSVMRFAKRER